MSQIIAITVPEVGAGDLPVTAVHVGPGDFVHADDVMLTLQTAAGPLDVPCGIMGTIRAVLVRVGDCVQEDALIGRVEMGSQPRSAPPPAAMQPGTPVAPAVLSEQAAPAPALPDNVVHLSPPPVQNPLHVESTRATLNDNLRDALHSCLSQLGEGDEEEDGDIDFVSVDLQPPADFDLQAGSDALRAAAAMLADFDATAPALTVPATEASPEVAAVTPLVTFSEEVRADVTAVTDDLPIELLDAATATAMLDALPVLGDDSPAESQVSLSNPTRAVVVPFPTAPETENSAAPVADPAPSASAVSQEISAPTMSETITTPPPAPVSIDCDMLVLGAGPGGYSAAFRSADLGMKTVLVERYATLGGVCLNVGCIPSKALLHIAAVLEEARELSEHGVTFGEPQIDIDKLRGWKSKVVSKLTGGLGGMAKGRKVTQIQGLGQFTGPNTLQAVGADGAVTTITFKKAIIAAGSQAVKLPFMPNNDPRVIDSTGALELPLIPKKMLVIGGGIIGLEMATVYSALGAEITVVELGKQLMPGADPDLVKVWSKYNGERFKRGMLETGVTAAEAKPEGIEVTYTTGEKESFDLVLVAVGRTPNGNRIAADKAGVAVTDRGFINVDKQMRTNVPHIFAIGDVVGQPMLAHKAVHEAHVAAEVAAGELQGNQELARAAFEPLLIPSVAYTNPEVAWAGKTEAQCAAEGLAVEKAVFPWAASGRAIANGRDEGFTKLLFDASTHRLVGGAIVGTGAGDLIGEICLAVEMGCDAVDIGKTIHPHPTLCESVGMAAEVAHGSCTDLPPARKKK